MKDKLEKLYLWFCHHFRIEKKAIPNLHGIASDAVITGRMYEWWGRIVKPEQNPNDVEISYIIQPDPNASLEAVNLVCNNFDRLTVLDKVYKTYDAKLAEALKQAGLFVEDMIKGQPCQLCCMSEYGLPCPECDFKRYWKLVATYKQNCTDQEAWNRAMIKRITNKR